MKYKAFKFISTAEMNILEEKPAHFNMTDFVFTLGPHLLLLHQ